MYAPGGSDLEEDQKPNPLTWAWQVGQEDPGAKVFRARGPRRADFLVKTALADRCRMKHQFLFAQRVHAPRVKGNGPRGRALLNGPNTQCKGTVRGGGGRTDAPPRPRRLAVTPCMTDMISPCTKYIAGGAAQSVVASRRRASPQRHAAKASVARAAVALDLVCKLAKVACSLGRRQCARMTHRFARAAPSP